VGAYIHRLHLSIDYALSVSYKRNLHDGKSKFVARITLVKAIPFYGFHVGYRYYLKIYMLDPMVMTRLADLLQQGVIMKKGFQPFEAHLQHLLQWMSDYNLYGCDYIDCSKVVFRSPVPKYEELAIPFHLWHDRSIPEGLVSEQSDLPRLSHCSIEVDICVQDIMNRRDIKPRSIHHDFIERLNPLAPDEKLVRSMAGLWRDEARRRKSTMLDLKPGSNPVTANIQISMSNNSRNSQPRGWIHEDDHREKLMALIAGEKSKSDDANPSFATFVKHNPLEPTIRTSLEAVEDLFPENLRASLGFSPETSTRGIGNDIYHQEDRVVDEQRILDLDMNDDDQINYDSDEDAMWERNLRAEHRNHVENNRLDLADMDQEEHEIDNILRPDGDHPTEQVHSSSDPNVFKRATSSSGQDMSALSTVSEHPPSEVLESGRVLDTSVSSLLSQPSLKPHFEPPEAVLADADYEHKWIVGHNHAINGVSLLPTTLSKKWASQECSIPPEKFQANPLQCPIVKDPHAFDTVGRLSQRTPSPPSASRKRKAASFDACAKVSNTANPIELSSLKFSPSTIALLDFHGPPPSLTSVISTMQNFDIPRVIYKDAFYSSETDVPEHSRDWAGREFKLTGSTAPFLPEFDPTGSSETSLGGKSVVLDKLDREEGHRYRRRACGIRSWEIASPSPSYTEVRSWLCNEKRSTLANAANPQAFWRTAASFREESKLSQIDGPTQKNKYGFKYTQDQAIPNHTEHEVQYMSTMSLEIHVNTRADFVPNPEEDEVQCLFWCFESDQARLKNNANTEGSHLGVIVLSKDGNMFRRIARHGGMEVQEETSELDLMIRITEIVRSHDPDILTGFEVHGSSWGYLIERACLKYDYDFIDELSRVKTPSQRRLGKGNDKWGFNNTSTIRVTGRHVINIWRAMRSELNLLQYTMENIVFHLLHRRVPHFTWADLTRWYESGKSQDIAKVIAYYTSRVQLDLEILEENELIARTSEQARILGVDFFSVFSRGSQFKVESLMFRIAKPENFLLVSPSRKQVGEQNALQCLPLVMEPQSAFYNSPVLVLDFQSLYPSVMIAYNYCYSTFLGRLVNWRGTNKMGFTEFKREQRLVELLKDHQYCAEWYHVFETRDTKIPLG
jgi:DNA polymerase zeta